MYSFRNTTYDLDRPFPHYCNTSHEIKVTFQNLKGYQYMSKFSLEKKRKIIFNLCLIMCNIAGMHCDLHTNVDSCICVYTKAR